jgi:branched-chain amino acid transport system permease protein
MRVADFKLSYRADEALFDSLPKQFWMALLVIALLAYPWFAGDYLIYMGCYLAINIVAAVGLNLLTGNAGLVSVGHGAFMAIGAYTAALGAMKAGLPFWITIPLAGFVAAGCGVIVGLPSLRIKGLYLAIATLASQYLVTFILHHWDWAGGGRGINIEPARIGPLRLDNDAKVYYLVIAVMLAMTVFARNLFRTRVGRAFIAVRDRDYSAEVLGVNLLQTKLLAFAISSFYAGVAGALLAYFIKFINPDQFGFSLSVFFFAIIIVGGLGSILGSILGAAFMTMVPEVLKFGVGLLAPFYPVQATVLLASVRELVFGLLIVGFLLFEPNGLAEIWRRTREKFRQWPFRT